MTLTLSKAFSMQSISAFGTPSQLLLIQTVHRFVTNGTIVIRAGNTSVALIGRGGYGGRHFASSAIVGFSNSGMSHRVGSGRSLREDGLQLWSEKSSGKGVLVRVNVWKYEMSSLLVPMSRDRWNLEYWVSSVSTGFCSSLQKADLWEKRKANSALASHKDWQDAAWGRTICLQWLPLVASGPCGTAS